MSSLKVDKDTNDLVVEGNTLVIVNGALETQQQLRADLQEFFGEWFLDTTRGVPYFEEVFVKLPNPSRVDAIFKNFILKSAGVLELLSFNLEIIDRGLQLDFEVRSVDGNIKFSEVLR